MCDDIFKYTYKIIKDGSPINYIDAGRDICISGEVLMHRIVQEGRSLSFMYFCQLENGINGYFDHTNIVIRDSDK